VCVDENLGDAGGTVCIDDAGPGVDARRAETIQGAAPEVVIPDAGEEGDRAAGPGGGQGLVCALAAAVDRELTAEDRLPGARQRRYADDHVGVG